MRKIITALLAAVFMVSGLSACGSDIDAHAKAACRYSAQADDVTGDLSDPKNLVAKGTAEIKSYAEAGKSSNAGLRQAAHGDIDQTHAQISAWCRNNL